MPTPPEAITGTVHRIDDGAGERDVIAGFGAVAVHGGEQDFARAIFHQLFGMRHGVDAGGVAPAMGEDFDSLPLARRPCLASMAATMHWLPNFSAASRTNSGRRHGGGVDRDLVGARQQQGADVFQGAHARRPPSAA